MEVKEYSQELQKLYLEFMMNDHELFVRVNNIVKPEYFDRPLRSTVEFIQEHASEYGAMPTHEQVKAITCLLYTSPSPRDQRGSRMASSA